MSFNTELQVNDKIYIDLIGELDIYSASEFMEETQELIKEYDKEIVFDFEDLEYLDSSGLGALISILKESQENDKKVYIKNVKPRIRKLFNITKIEDMFEFIG